MKTERKTWPQLVDSRVESALNKSGLNFSSKKWRHNLTSTFFPPARLPKSELLGIIDWKSALQKVGKAPHHLLDNRLKTVP